MSDVPVPPATELLLRAGGGDELASQALLDRLYRELHLLAERAMQGERADHTLQPTALVHEAWLRLVDDGEHASWDSRSHFLALAAKAMRNVLVDHARRRRAIKRGDEPDRIDLDEAVACIERRDLDVLQLDEMLDRLRTRDAELARVVELRFFGGLTVEETGRVLGRSVRQVEGAWVTARGWLHRELARGGGT